MELPTFSSIFRQIQRPNRLPIMDVINRQYVEIMHLLNGGNLFQRGLSHNQNIFFHMIVLINNIDLTNPVIVAEARVQLSKDIEALETNFQIEVGLNQTSEIILLALSRLSVSYDEFKKQLIRLKLLNPSSTSFSADLQKHISGLKGSRRDDENQCDEERSSKRAFGKKRS